MILTFSIILWIIQGAACIAAILYYPKYKHSSQRYFVYFLSYVVLNEILGYLVSANGYANWFLYNIFTIVSFSFYFYWFFAILKEKKMVILLSILFSVSIFYALIYEDFFSAIWSIPLTVGTIIILILATIFYRNLLNKTEVVNFKRSQKFWIVSGLLIFYLGFLPIQLFMFTLSIKGIPIRIMITILNIILYGCYIKSFLCLKK
ncbi:MAG: hypothetical protein V3U80_04260 [Flavobacteriaceae bacterium]